MAERGARASGTPFISFFAPTEVLALARLRRSPMRLGAGASTLTADQLALNTGDFEDFVVNDGLILLTADESNQ